MSVRVSSMRRTRNASKMNPAAKNARAFHGPCPALDLFVSLMLEFLTMLSRSLVTSALVLIVALTSTAQTAIPRAADGHPNFQGIWQAKSVSNDNVGRLVDGGSIPYLPAAAAQRAKNAASRNTADPL